jgi:hypothetical protein
MGGERDSIVGLETKGIHRAGKGRSTLLPIYSFEGPCYRGKGKKEGLLPPFILRLLAVGTLKRYSKALEYEYRVKTVALGTLKRYSILSLTLYLEWYCAYSILYSGGPH